MIAHRPIAVIKEIPAPEREPCPRGKLERNQENKEQEGLLRLIRRASCKTHISQPTLYSPEPSKRNDTTAVKTYRKEMGGQKKEGGTSRPARLRNQGFTEKDRRIAGILIQSIRRGHPIKG